MPAITQFTGFPSTRLVRLDGDLDLFAALRLRRILNAAVTAGCPQLTVDVEHVTFVDASALGLLERAWTELRARSVVVDVINPSPRFCWLVDVIGLQDTFQLQAPRARPAS
ncbi:MAG: hypothetical protein JWO11_259 [Nocardioides sp.]|nr:hypothetical protein [Nocardioides sp.]